MPCLNISTNVNLDGVDTSAILAEATSAVAKIIGKPESMKGAAQSYICPGLQRFLLLVFILCIWPCLVSSFWDEISGLGSFERFSLSKSTFLSEFLLIFISFLFMKPVSYSLYYD